MPRILVILAFAALAAACDIQETTLARPEHIIVAEVVLVADAELQTAWLHHTRVSDPESDPRVRGAGVVVTRADGNALIFGEVQDSMCYFRRRDAGNRVLGTCYAASAANFVRPGESYQLEIRTADGRILTGSTVVPDAFEVVRPEGEEHTIPAGTHYEIAWTRARNAWVYVVETWFYGLGAALAPLEVPQDPILFRGLSISGSDTTLTLPREVGIFDRFEKEKTPVLIALQKGLPPGVHAVTTISAADRNYVNWVRAGTFNPNGQVRVPSVHGTGGTGVFGSVVQRTVTIGSR